jgi:hypothetical protein
LAVEESASGFGRVCVSPQYSTAAKITNIATTQTVTRSESVGMRMISYGGESMPAVFNEGFDLYQARRDFR